MRSSVAFRFFSILGCFVLFEESSLGAPISELRRITVSGVCQREVTPDRGSVTLTAEVRENDLKVAAQKATASYERVRDAVKKLNLQDLELRTVEYTMGEVREWENQKTVLKGFRARLGLRVVTSQVDKLGEVLAIGTREGLKDIGGLQSFLSEKKQLSEEVACLQEAAQNARTKAEKLASSLGSSVGEALTVSESGGNPFSVPVQRMMMASPTMASSEGAGAPSIEAGQQTLKFTVEVSFGLK